MLSQKAGLQQRTSGQTVRVANLGTCSSAAKTVRALPDTHHAAEYWKNLACGASLPRRATSGSVRSYVRGLLSQSKHSNEQDSYCDTREFVEAVIRLKENGYSRALR